MATNSPNPKVAEQIETVLVVEGDVLARIVICEYLRHCGYRVLEAVNADEAVLLLSQSNIAIEAVLTDVKVAGSMNGFALTQWVRANKPGVDVIIVGSPAGAADAAANLCETGPMLAKPYDPQLVVDRIRRLRALRQRKSGG
jgi:DNA-binding response OmpR family regulator